ncbi:hypothetical protein SADUNF_Sadunf16G0188700 [Salix dunnii]|uniref:Uncharacterized protein n=1 Tax=Salix dunnii TaxID=1413687 RepID=A0A835MGX1_9ROSI|nr:hypothetical protein SADUNF_Sadunf16G0188700 [Salix dunnii]
MALARRSVTGYKISKDLPQTQRQISGSVSRKQNEVCTVSKPPKEDLQISYHYLMQEDMNIQIFVVSGLYGKLNGHVYELYRHV